MSDSQVEFARRLRRLDRKHSALSQGYVTAIRPDGLIVLKPRKAAPRLQLRAVLIFMLGFFAFKGFMIAEIGLAGYQDRVNELASGTVFEQAGAYVMAADRVSLWASQQIGPLIR